MSNILDRHPTIDRLAAITQSVSTLTYRLLTTAPDLESMVILAEERFAWRDVTVTINILGASHAVSLERAGSVLTELLTCTPPAGAVYPVAIHATGSPAQIKSECGGYVVETRLFTQAIDTPTLSTDLANTLQRDYPYVGGDVAPTTRVDWEIIGDALKVRTLHTYPNEGKEVVSETQFRIQDPPE